MAPEVRSLQDIKRYIDEGITQKGMRLYHHGIHTREAVMQGMEGNSVYARRKAVVVSLEVALSEASLE